MQNLTLIDILNIPVVSWSNVWGGGAATNARLGSIHWVHHNDIQIDIRIDIKIDI